MFYFSFFVSPFFYVGFDLLADAAGWTKFTFLYKNRRKKSLKKMEK